MRRLENNARRTSARAAPLRAVPLRRAHASRTRSELRGVAQRRAARSCKACVLMRACRFLERVTRADVALAAPPRSHRGALRRRGAGDRWIAGPLDRWTAG
jgi:hypothetical protein